MKVVCKKTTSKDFDLNFVTTIFRNDFDYTYGGKWGLEINKEYLVMGFFTYKDTACVYYLIDVHGKPDCFPSLLFEISDNSLPHDWYINIRNSGFNLICGFEEFCNDEDFFLQLMERQESAIFTYFNKKKEYEINE